MARSRRLIALMTAFIMLLCMFATSCRGKGDDFPDIVYPDDEETSSTSSPSEPDDSDLSIQSITVASPYSAETIQYLVKLYYCKNNDMLGENTGGTISLDYLQSIDPNYIVNSILTSGEGASAENIEQWSNSNTDIPDVFLTGDVGPLKDKGLITPLNDLIAGSRLLSPGNVYTNALEQISYEGIYYAITYYSSVQVIAGNPEYIPSSGKLSFKCSTVQFEEYLAAIRDEHNTIPLSTGRDMVPYLLSAFNEDEPSSFMMYDEYKTNRTDSAEVINNTLRYISDLYSNGLSADLNSEGTNPVYARQAGMWLISSSEVLSWEQYYPSGLYYVALPLDSESSVINPMARLYSLCINNTSANKEFAASFAMFMALDSDARMLLERLEPQIGFLPCVRSQDVWSIVNSDSIWGQTAVYYYQILDRAVYCPSSSDPLYSSVADYLADYNGDAFNAEACYGQHR